MGKVIRIKSVNNSAYLDLKNLFNEKLEKVDTKINERLDSDVELIKKMCDHHLSSGGKRLRALLTLASSRISVYELGNRDINLAACVELIHSATLLHDDVIDKSDLRRGVKTTNHIWGNHSSVLVGDYLLSRCFELMVEDGDLEVLKLLSSTATKIAQGEVLQLQYMREADLNEEIYLKIINMKTASLFSAATKVGSIICNNNEKEKEALKSYGKNLGIAFQIADDTLDYLSKENILGKKIGKDFFEGKATLPVILSYQRSNTSEKNFLREVFKKNEKTKNDFSKTLDIINKYNSIDESFNRAKYFVSVAHDSIGFFQDSKEKKLLQNLTDYSLNRTY